MSPDSAHVLIAVLIRTAVPPSSTLSDCAVDPAVWKIESIITVAAAVIVKSPVP